MTLMESMVATSLMSIVVTAALWSANYFGMRQDQLVESKCGSSDSSRRAINAMRNDIRTTKGYYIGSYNPSSVPPTFTPCVAGNYQSGPALILYPTVNSTNQAVDASQSIVYYYDTTYSNVNNTVLWRVYSINNVAMNTSIAASNLIYAGSNTLNFLSEDYLGNLQTTRTYKGVIHTTLRFCKFQYPMTAVGSNCLYDAYQIDCRVTPHLPDGP